VAEQQTCRQRLELELADGPRGTELGLDAAHHHHAANAQAADADA
jgi:hypothetical protein